MNIGIYGGSFNPIHFGHIGLVKWVAEHSDLDEVWLMVSPNNPLKKSKVDTQKSKEGPNYDLSTNFAERFRAAQQALAETPCTKTLRASDFEDHLPRPSYTANTLRELTKAYPEHVFSLIIGADNWALFDKWKEYDFILSNFRIFVYPRPGYDITPRPGCDMSPRPDLTAKALVFCSSAPTFDISSTQLRTQQ